MKHQARKRFGQNFLHDEGVIERIVRTIAPREGDRLVEIGPGLGALSVPLLREVGRLFAIELDRDLIAKVEAATAGHGDFRVRNTDALGVDYGALAEELGGPIRVIGNLPYNISTPLMFHLFGHRGAITDMHFMLQKEVVERLAAGAGEPHYGRLGVMAQFHCRVEARFVVPPGCFRPPPKVDSAIVSLYPHPEPPVEAVEARLSRVVTAAFAQRRKTLRNSLRALVDSDTIEACGVDPTQRPERITLAEYAAISRQPFLDSGH